MRRWPGRRASYGSSGCPVCWAPMAPGSRRRTACARSSGSRARRRWSGPSGRASPWGKGSTHWDSRDENPLVVSLLLLTVSAAAVAQAQSPMALFPGAELAWKDGPQSLPRGAKMVILEGDPTQPGMFTMRLRFPDGFQVFPHWHTQTEHVTVIKGTLHLGMGERFDRASTRTLVAGSFGYWPAGTRHFAWAEGETILQW